MPAQPPIEGTRDVATARKKHKEPRSEHRKPEHVKAEARPRIPGLSSRPVWRGHLRLSLVSCPVALYRATSKANDISFHLVNPDTNNRVRMIPTDPDKGPVERQSLVKGYELAKNRYVLISDEELDSVRLESTHTLDIERFVDVNDIDRLFFDDPYILLPSDTAATGAYTVIRAAMTEVGRVALGRVVMHTRERLMAIEPRSKGLLAYTLRMRDEVVNIEKALESVPDVKPGREMIAIAAKIIEQLEGPFNPDEFKDRYEESLRELIRMKEKGKEPETVAPPSDTTNVVDLMDALKKSLGKKAPAKSAPPKSAAAASKVHKKRSR
jgi:DNA end-binding protein Ku